MKRYLFAIPALLLIIAQASFAQASASGAELVYVDGGEFTVTYRDGTVFDYRKGGVTEGDLIPVGASIRTGPKTMAELRLKPNKSIIKLSRGTTFTIESLASTSTDSRRTNAFALAAGKARVIAAKLSGKEEFKLKGQTAVCGVRGTDFTFAANPGSSDRLTVKRGLVDFARLLAGAEDLSSTVSVGAGQYSDAALQGALAVMSAGADVMSEAFNGMDFLRAKESEVPGYEIALASPEPSPSPEASASPQASPSPETSASPEASPTDEGLPAPSASVQPPTPSATPRAASSAVASGTDIPSTQPSPSPGPSASESGAKPNPFMKWLSDFMNAEIGAITINGETFAKAVLQPVIQVGKLKTALYLPIIYRDNLFDPDDWYHPQGNDEWSFGTDIGWGTDALGAFVDATKDLALKVKYLEYGDQQFDSFFIKVGNLPSISLGHGMLMKGYANDSEFPVLRRVGFDIGFNLANSKPFGLEFLSNDLADPEIYGLRLLTRPVKKSPFAIGISSVVDVSPASMLDSADYPDISDGLGDPMLAGFGIDLDAPIINTDLLALKAFADAGAIVPIVVKDYSMAGAAVERGVKFGTLWDEEAGRLRNWGAMFGALGSIGPLFDWRAEFRYSTGNFVHGRFDRNYDANRGEIAAGYAAALADPATAAEAPDVMGVYGEGGFNLFKDKLAFTLGYFWPWSVELGFDLESQLGVLSNDKLSAELRLGRGLIPVFDVSGYIGYYRTGFASALASGESGGQLWSLLFDEDTSFRGEILFPMPKAPNLDIALLFALAPERDANGDIVFADALGLKPYMVPVLSLETRLHF